MQKNTPMYRKYVGIHGRSTKSAYGKSWIHCGFFRWYQRQNRNIVWGQPAQA